MSASQYPFFFFFFSRDRVSLCIPGCPGTHSVDQAGLELRDLPASASQVLGLQACATTVQPQCQDFKGVSHLLSEELVPQRQIS